MKQVTDADMRQQVLATLTDWTDDYDVAGLVSDLIDRYGLVDIESIPGDDYWAIVQRHDLSSCMQTRPSSCDDVGQNRHPSPS